MMNQEVSLALDSWDILYIDVVFALLTPPVILPVGLHFDCFIICVIIIWFSADVKWVAWDKKEISSMYNFIFVTEKEAKPYKDKLIEMTLELQDLIREHFTF